MTISINADLIAAGTKYKKELLAMPVAVLSDALPQMTVRTGIQGKIVGGLLSTDAELRPYRTAKDAVDNTAVTPEEWETFLGDVVKEFDPHAILGTLYSELTSKGVKEYDFVKRIALEMSKKVGEKLYDNLFTAVRNGSGDHTHDLFNGFDTIAAAAIGAGTISAANKNYQDLTSTPITASNAGEVLKDAYRALIPVLRKQNVNLYLPIEVLWMYEDWYQAEYGTQPWNIGYEQKQLVGSKCNIIPLDNMGGNYAYFTLKENLNVGFDQQSDVETVRIRECDNPKTVQFFMKSYFGAGFETVQKEYFTTLAIDAGLGSGSV
jgi:hypothetical protein